MTKIFIIFLLLSTQVWAQTGALTQEFKTLVQQSKIGPIADQAYCYSENGKIQGYQVDKLQRIASLTKIFTTYLASENLDLNQKYKTKFYIGKDSLHIEGGSDPYFEEDKLLVLMKTLNDLGHHSFKRVTMTRSFLFYDQAMGSHQNITAEASLQRLAFYLKSKNAAGIKKKWLEIKKFAEEEEVLLNGNAPIINAEQIVISDINPLVNENHVTYLHVSRPLHAILKAMNVQSKNFVSQNVYLEASKTRSLKTLLNMKGIASSNFNIQNGSGLPIIASTSRVDNQATCKTVINVVSLLKERLLAHQLQLSDVMAVTGGEDLGSFRERFEKYPETHEAVLAKTGTLKHTSSLGGLLLSQNNLPFAILNHTTAALAARNFQDKFVARMFDFLGTASPMDYEKISIFPWDGTEFLQTMH